MTDGIVHRPPREHWCFAINRHGITLTDPYWNLGAGTVIQCPECGQTWRAVEPPAPRGPGYVDLGVRWRRETRWERWKRERRRR